jgi:hypothetical protein
MPLNIPERSCRFILVHPEMSNATARIASWLVGVSSYAEYAPIELSLRQIENGVDLGAYHAPGTGCRYETIRASIEWLESNGFLSSEEGRTIGFGHQARVYKLEV